MSAVVVTERRSVRYHMCPRLWAVGYVRIARRGLDVGGCFGGLPGASKPTPRAHTWSQLWARMRVQFWGPNLVPVSGPTFRFAYRFVLKTAAEVPKMGPKNGARFSLQIAPLWLQKWVGFWHGFYDLGCSRWRPQPRSTCSHPLRIMLAPTRSSVMLHSGPIAPVPYNTNITCLHCYLST